MDALRPTGRKTRTRPMPPMLCAAAVFLAMVFVFADSEAQPPHENLPSPNSRTVLQSLKDSLFDLDQEVQLLQHFLEASTVDPRLLWNTDLHSWRMNNPALRDSVFSSFMAVDSSVESEAGAEAVVLATLDDDLVEVRFGNAVFKGVTLKRAMERSGDPHLYAKVAQSYRYSPAIELRDPAVQIPTAYFPAFLESTDLPARFPQTASRPVFPPMAGYVDIDLSSVTIRAGEHWGGELRLGFDNANLPFWSSGTVQLLALYDMLKVGVVLPIRGGLYEPASWGPFLLRPRRLNGAPGYAASADFGIVGGSLAFLRMNADNLISLTDPDDFYYLSGYVQLWSSFGVSLGPRSSARAKLGLGMHHINHARVTKVQPAPEFVILDENQSFSPYISLEYQLNRDSGVLHGGVEFFDLTLSLFGSVDVVPGILSLEARYLWPIGPKVRSWENPEFLFLSPQLHLNF